MTLLGQNVNSFRDVSESSYYGGASTDSEDSVVQDRPPNWLGASNPSTSPRREGGDSRTSGEGGPVDPEMRIRFTSPHPKDFPDEVR